jgi:hypothetical protein
MDNEGRYRTSRLADFPKNLNVTLVAITDEWVQYCARGPVRRLREDFSEESARSSSWHYIGLEDSFLKSA